MEVAGKAAWLGGMRFEGSGWSGTPVLMDAARADGGEESAARPLELLLVGLCGCTGMDVVSLLRKMHVDFTGLEFRVRAEKSEEHPHVFTRIDLEYVVSGRDVDADKVRRAIDLSQEKYCSVSAMLKRACPVNYTVRIVDT